MDSKLSAAGQLKIGDLDIHRIGLGTNRLTDTPENARLIARAMELGLNFIDTADVYTYGESETTLGKYLAEHYRQGLVIATKGGVVRGHPLNGSPEHLRQALDASLKRLRTERIDLYQLHWPDPETPLEESVGALQELRRQGKIRHVGLSNVSIAQIELARSLGPIVSVQNDYSLANREHQDVLEHCQRHGIAFLPYFPLKSDGYQAQLDAIASKHAADPNQIILAWLLQRADVMVPIPGTLSPEHLASNLAAGSIKLDAADLQLLNEVSG